MLARRSARCAGGVVRAVPHEVAVDPERGVGASDLQEEIVCAIDLGSRNFKAVAGRVSNGALVTWLLDKRRVELGEHLAGNDGVISQAKIAGVVEALEALVARARAEGASTVLAVGTQALREARNAGAVVRAADAAGVEVEVASGEREAELAYLCATGGAPDRLVSDLGSRSLEIAWRTGSVIESRCVDLGYARAFAACFADASGFGEARAAYDALLARCIDFVPEGTERLLCLASNTLASYVLGRPKEEVASRPLARAALTATIRGLERLAPGPWREHRDATTRAEKILPGLVLLDHVMRRSGHDEAVVSEVELPAGLIVDHLARTGRLPAAGVPMHSG